MEDQEFTPCEDCTNPNGCLTACGIKEFIKENSNVAELRGETPEQLYGEEL
jgi:hypothetical protein